MYNPLLDTFIAVAETGSFNKASDVLYLSPTAVMKQLNALERHLGLRLVVRTNEGVTLTAAGEALLQDARFLKSYSRKALEAARALTREWDTTFCVGTSLLNPAKPFMDLWYQVNRAFPDYKLHLVPFTDDHEGILAEIGKLGEAFDFLIGVCDSKAWMSRANFLPLGRYPKMIAVRRGHPLAQKERLSCADLEGMTLMMVKAGDSDTNDALRNDLMVHHPGITIEDTPHFYDLSVFNRCAETDNLLLSISAWQNVHPGLVTIPVDWTYSIPYGLLYSRTPPDDVLKLVSILRELKDGAVNA